MNRVIRKMRGFTLIELIVVIAIIGILATITIIGFSRYQSDTRDARRASSASVIVEALEKYYDANGEYPSCGAVSAAASTVTTTTLTGLDPSILVAPQAPSGVTNSIKCTSGGNTLTVNGQDFFEYQGDGSNECNTNGSCLDYTLKYKSEISGQIVSIASRRNTSIATSGNITNLAANATSFSTIQLTWQSISNASGYKIEQADDMNFSRNTSYTTVGPTGNTGTSIGGLTSGNTYYFQVMPIGAAGTANWSNPAYATTNALATPVITATANSNSQITVSWPTVQYATGGYTLQYTINGNSWTSPTPTQATLSPSSTQDVITGLSTGVQYFFRLQAFAPGNTSAWSAPANATTYVPAPSSLSLAVNSSTQITATWGAVSVATSYTLQYSPTSDFSSSVTTQSSLVSSSQTYAATGLTQGLTYYFRVYALVGSAQSASQPASPPYPSATTTVDAPGNPGITAYRPGATRAQTAGWWIITPGAGNYYYAYASAGTSCPAGTYPVYQFASDYNANAAGSPGPGSYAYSGASTGPTWYMVQPTSGYKIKFGAQAYCQGASTNSAWSGYNFSCAANPGTTVACTW